MILTASLFHSSKNLFEFTHQDILPLLNLFITYSLHQE